VGNRACHSFQKSAAVLARREKHAAFELYTVLLIKDCLDHERVALAVSDFGMLYYIEYFDSRRVLAKFLDSRWLLF